MHDREKVIGHMNDCLEASRADNGWVFVRKDIVEDALALLKEQEEQIEIKTENFNRLAAKVAVQPEIVRCKDCKWGERIRNMRGDERIRCRSDYAGIECGYSKEPDWFCADGERS